MLIGLTKISLTKTSFYYSSVKELTLRLPPMKCTQAHSHHEQNKIQTVTANLTQCDCLYPCPFHITFFNLCTKPRVREKPKARGTSPDRSLAQLKEGAEGIVLWKLQWVCHTACPEGAVQLRAALSFSWQDLAFCARPNVIVEIKKVGPSLCSSPLMPSLMACL